MLTRSNQLTIAIVVLVGVLIGLFFFYRATIPSAEQIVQAENQIDVKPIDKDWSSSSLEAKLNQKVRYGKIPVEINESEQGRDNPFNSY